MSKSVAPSLGWSTRVLRVRVKDKHAPWLREQARGVNLVWNYCNETSLRIFERERRYASAFDLDKLTSGAAKAGLDLHSQTVQAVSAEFVTRRRQFKKLKLRWRVSDRKKSNYSLGWVPFKASAVSYKRGQVHFRGQPIGLWDSYGLAGYELGPGSFSEDARGRWYFNVTVKVEKREKPVAEELQSAVGIDLGLKDFMTDSNGTTVAAEQFYRDLEPKLATSQRAGQKARTRAIHAKIANRRKDTLHKLSTTMARRYGAVFVGDVSASQLAQTSMAKSVLDAGWSKFRTMLLYKCDDAGTWFKEVDESYSTQECSSCSARTGPKGREGLAVRKWTCSNCGTEHGRDHNAALNIRARGLKWLDEQFAAAEQSAANETA